MLAKIHTPQARVQARPSARRHAVVVRAAAATEMPRWPVMFQELTKAKLETISPQEAKARVDSGASSIPPSYRGLVTAAAAHISNIRAIAIMCMFRLAVSEVIRRGPSARATPATVPRLATTTTTTYS